jgi:hypothetical protein
MYFCESARGSRETESTILHIPHSDTFEGVYGQRGEQDDPRDRYYLCSPSNTIGLPVVPTTWISVACWLLRLKEDGSGLLFVQLLLTLAPLYCPLDGTLITNGDS